MDMAEGSVAEMLRRREDGDPIICGMKTFLRSLSEFDIYAILKTTTSAGIVRGGSINGKLKTV
jgi:hypothetical protein